MLRARRPPPKDMCIGPKYMCIAGPQAICIEFYVCFHTWLPYTSGAVIICVWDEQYSHTAARLQSIAIFWFSTRMLWKSGKPSGCHDVKRADYITNSVRCQGKVIFLNKMKGELGRLGQLKNWHNRPFFMENFGIMQNVQAQAQLEKWHICIICTLQILRISFNISI